MVNKPGFVAGVNDGQTRMLQGVAEAVKASKYDRAAEIASTAIGFGMEHPNFFYARALGAQEDGRLGDALADFQRVLTYLPRDANVLNATALCLARLNRLDEAIAHFDTAIEIKPSSALTHYRKGWALVTKGDHAAAWLSYQRALDIRPDFAEVLAGMASIAARDGDGEKARQYAGRALKINPREPTALVALAMADNAAGDYAAGEARLKPLVDDPSVTGHTKAVALGFMGDSLDGQDRFAEAFVAYTGENEEFRKLHEPRFADHPRFSKKIAEWIAYFEAAPKEPWQSSEASPHHADGPRQHIFLLGFLRSGTTLLEQVLATHPDVVRLEERETFAAIAPVYMADAEGRNRLANIEGAELAMAREAYWRSVLAFGADPKGKVFVDKQPLNTFNLPLIAKLFPDAKILFALRDPRDVVFSCFRRHFEINAMMFEFLRLTDAAAFYALVMQLAEVYRAKLPLDILEHRYEDMVEDFDSSVKRVCDFIGIAWTSEMRNFSEAAHERHIRSPSAAQVRRPLYGEGIGQWRPYATELAPMLDILKPWVERFGYPSA